MKKFTLPLVVIALAVLVLAGFGCSEKTTETNQNTSGATNQTNAALANTNAAFVNTNLEDDQGEPLPAKDVIGEDVPGISRYPGSIRVSYGKNADETHASYKTKDELDQVQIYYKDLLESKGYALYSIDESEMRFYLGSDYYYSNDTIDIDFYYDEYEKTLTYTIYHYLTEAE